MRHRIILFTAILLWSSGCGSGKGRNAGDKSSSLDSLLSASISRVDRGTYVSGPDKGQPRVNISIAITNKSNKPISDFGYRLTIRDNRGSALSKTFDMGVNWNPFKPGDTQVSGLSADRVFPAIEKVKDSDLVLDFHVTEIHYSDGSRIRADK